MANKVSTKQFAELLIDITSEKSQKEIPKILDSYIELLQRNKMLSKVDKVIDKYNELHNNITNILDVQVYSKEKLSNSNEDAIKERVKKLFDAKDVNIENIIDEKLSGGIKIKVKDSVIDLSLNHKINQLKNYLIKYS